jgi:hypothetical protein
MGWDELYMHVMRCDETGKGWSMFLQFKLVVAMVLSSRQRPVRVASVAKHNLTLDLVLTCALFFCLVLSCVESVDI